MDEFNLTTYIETAFGCPVTEDLEICGLDEVGRGSFAGPLVAAAVVFTPSVTDERIKDSKQLSQKQRTTLVPVIQSYAVRWKVISISANDIDTYGVGWANRYAFECLLKDVEADVYCCDGTLQLSSHRKWHSLPRGDQYVRAVAAASVLAKTHRDAYMESLHADAPEYAWESNKGYGSQSHRDAIVQFGMHPQHRRSFIHMDGVTDREVSIAPANIQIELPLS